MSDSGFDDSEKRGRRRPASLAYTQKVEALRIVDPLTEKLGEWSPRAAYLLATAGRPGMKEAAVASSLAEAQTILAEVRKARTDLAEKIKDLPAEVAAHSRVTDTRRSLDALEAHLTAALLLLDR